MEPVSVIIVNYNTPGIISRAVNSICFDENVMTTYIVDNSDVGSPAYNECDLIASKSGQWPSLADIKVIHTGKNIGHGPGLNMGIEKTQTDCIIVMDSDAVLVDHTVIEEMHEAIQDENVYGAGMVVRVDNNGGNKKNGEIEYLHPYFAMFRKYEFLQHSPFINHGAPWLRTMKEISGIKKVINIPEIDKKVWHEKRKTREIAGKSWQLNWEKA